MMCVCVIWFVDEKWNLQQQQQHNKLQATEYKFDPIEILHSQLPDYV